MDTLKNTRDRKMDASRDVSAEILGIDTSSLVGVLKKCTLRAATMLVAANHRLHRYCRDCPEVFRALRDVELRCAVPRDAVISEKFDNSRPFTTVSPEEIDAKVRALFG